MKVPRKIANIRQGRKYLLGTAIRWRILPGRNECFDIDTWSPRTDDESSWSSWKKATTMTQHFFEKPVKKWTGLLKDHLHWRTLRDNAGDSDTYCTCLGNLWRCDTDRIVSIYVATPKVAKASTVSCHCRWRQRQHYLITFANVNTALKTTIFDEWVRRKKLWQVFFLFQKVTKVDKRWVR